MKLKTMLIVIIIFALTSCEKESTAKDIDVSLIGNISIMYNISLIKIGKHEYLIKGQGICHYMDCPCFSEVKK